MKTSETRLEHVPEILELLNEELSDFLPDYNDIKELLLEFLTDDRHKSIVLVAENIVIGFGVILFERKIRGGLAGHIEDVVIKKQYQGRGYGKMLVNSLMDHATVANCYKVSLQCKKRNVLFYSKLGFEESGFCMQKFQKVI